MRTEKERNLLLKALDGFKRKIVVISRDFRILASAGVDALIERGVAIRKMLPRGVLQSPRTLRQLPGQKSYDYWKAVAAGPFIKFVEQTKKILLVCLPHHGRGWAGGNDDFQL